MARAVPALLGVALVLSLASLAYQQVRTQRQRDAEVIAKLRRQLVEAEQAKLAALSQLKEAQGGGAGQQAGAHSFIHSVDTLPYQRDDLVMMTFATGGVRDMLDNWVRHVRVLKLPILVAAMDEVVLSQCKSEGFECYSCVKEKDDMPRYIRGDFAGFRALGVRKVDALLPILRRGVHVILSDVDAVWLHDPNPMVRGVTPGFEDFAHADMIVSTDCHNPESDFDNAGCFGDLLDKNTGVMCACRPRGTAACQRCHAAEPPAPFGVTRPTPNNACAGSGTYARRQTASRRWQSGECAWRPGSGTSRIRPPLWISSMGTGAGTAGA
tara:strand:+ start:546 stop:1520 length:975 start_codon:yes stop_codon:yes gene_type:complete